MPTITVFRNSPDEGRGLARDMRVRWALEEVGAPYDVRLVTFAEMREPAHLARQPFGQIPTYEDGGLILFESGAIVDHIARSRPGLLPDDPAARARAVAWMYAAVGTVEPPIVEREMSRYVDPVEIHRTRLPGLDERIHARLRALSDRLGGAEWLDGDFSAGDLMMVSVLLRIAGTPLLEAWPNLAAYVARGEARPAYRRAFAAQLAVFRAAAG